jgi:hypothetical protein
LCFLGNWSTGNINDHGSRPGNTSQKLTPQQHPVTSAKALSMLYWARHTASPNTATMVIKTDQYNQ